MITGLKVVSYITVSVGLFITYVYFFGQDSFRKYLEGAIIIIEQEEKNVLIPPPGKNYVSSFYFFLKSYL